MEREYEMIKPKQLKYCLRCGNPNVTPRRKLYRRNDVFLCESCENLWYKIYYDNPECKHKEGAWDLFFDKFLASIKREERKEYVRELQKKIPELRFTERFER